MPTMSDLRTRAKELGVKAPFGISKEELEKQVNAADEAETAPRITTTERTNPDLAPLKVMNDIVAGTETEDQMEARISEEVKAKLMREKIERKLREEARIAENKERQLNKHRLNYDIVDLKNKAEAMASAHGCQFVIDKKPDGSLAGTYHMYGKDKINSGNLAQPFATIISDLRIYCNTKIAADVPTRSDMVASQFTGAPIASTVEIVGQANAAAAVGDIAQVELQ